MEKLFEMLDDGTCPFKVVEISKKRLNLNGFREIDLNNSFTIEKGGRYYFSPYKSVLFAFTIGDRTDENSNMRIAMAHTDQPCFKLKYNPEIENKKYLQVNVEPYGGMLLETWKDRPLAMSGKVILKGADPFSPVTRLIDSKKPLFIIPSIAPHLVKDKKSNQEINIQKELMPIAALKSKEINSQEFIIDYLCSQLAVEKEAILAFDLFLYNADSSEKIGMNDEFISAPRIDNLASVSAILEGITCENRDNRINIAALFDNEEIGSRSKQGADSNLLLNYINSILKGLCLEDNLMKIMSKSFMLSIDGAHGFHPNYPEKSDITNETFLGDGIVIKTSATQRYVSDSEATAVVMDLCKRNNIPFQIQVNRSGMPGGQTLGPIAASYIPIQAVDIGIPMLAMHSSRELAAGSDYRALINLVNILFKKNS